jgi:hypothetical protein
MKRFRTTSRRILIGGLSALALAASVTGVVVAQQQADEPYVSSEPAPRDRPETEKTGQSMTVRDVKDHIKPLKRSKQSGDELPAAVANSPLLEDGVVNRDESRKVKGKQRWIVPSANGEAVCIVATSEVACPPASALAERGADVSVFWHADTPVRVTGIATDAVTAINLIMRDGSRTTIPVEDGSFEAELDTVPREVWWNGPEGRESLALGDIGP